MWTIIFNNDNSNSKRIDDKSSTATTAYSHTAFIEGAASSVS
jgi:hypothetical protein